MRRALFIVDTDVAQACSTSARPPAPDCMKFLDEILEICHRIVVSDELMEEWQRHTRRNAAFSRWLRRMFGRRKVERCGPVADEQLRTRAVSLEIGEGGQAEVEKDLHLLIVAIHRHAHIASLDEKARERFVRLAKHDARVGDLAWVNPRRDTDALIAWLRRGAPWTAEHGLGAPAQRGGRG